MSSVMGGRLAFRLGEEDVILDSGVGSASDPKQFPICDGQLQ